MLKPVERNSSAGIHPMMKMTHRDDTIQLKTLIRAAALAPPAKDLNQPHPRPPRPNLLTFAHNMIPSTTSLPQTGPERKDEDEKDDRTRLGRGRGR